MLRTAAFDAYIAPAKRYPAIWRLILGVITAVVVYMAAAVGVALLVGRYYGITEFDVLMTRMVAAEDPPSMILLFSTFIGMALGAIVACWWHWRGLASLIGPLGPALRDFLKTAILCVVMFWVIGFITMMVTGLEPTPNMSASLWLSYIPIMLVLLLIQTGAEELIFRGYLTQQLAARFTSPLIWFLFPAVLFALGHFNAELDPKLTWLILLATGVFGLIATDLTRITGNLGAAWGFHFVNNFFALMLVSVAGEMSGVSLYTAPFTMDDVSILMPLLLLDIVTIIIVWRIARRILR